jgi:hypothetical protein
MSIALQVDNLPDIGGYGDDPVAAGKRGRL